MNNSNNKCECTKKCQILLANPFECFPKYDATLTLNSLIQYLFTSSSGDQEIIDISKYAIKPLNSFKTDLIKEIAISNAHGEDTSNPIIHQKKNFEK